MKFAFMQIPLTQIPFFVVLESILTSVIFFLIWNYLTKALAEALSFFSFPWCLSIYNNFENQFWFWNLQAGSFQMVPFLY